MDTHEGTGILPKAACSRHPMLAPSQFQQRAHSVLSQNLLHVELLSVTQRLVLPVTPNEKIDDLKCVLHEIDLHAPPQALTTRSISTQAPSGSAAAAIVVRAGKG